MNGTCVNGMKLGKKDQHCIDQGDVISILQKDFKVLFFISETRWKEIYLSTFFQEQVSHKGGNKIIAMWPIIL